MLFPAVRHEVSFWHGAARLVGDLVLPATAGPHPVLLLVGGDGQVERDRSAWLDALAGGGTATFTWDRPGPRAETPAAQAREVLAAIRGLRSHPLVDGSALALAGAGTGGWAAAQAATFSSDVRALILMCTPLVPPAELAEHRLSERLREAGVAEDDADVARRLLAARLCRRASGAAMARVNARERVHVDRPWYRLMPQPGELGGPGDPRVLADPLPTLSAVTVPVLALFGEQDPLTPLSASVRGVRTALGGSGHADHEVAVVRGADHALRVRPGHGLGRLSRGRHQFGDWPAGLAEYLADWLDERLRPAIDVPGFVPPEPAASSGWPVPPESSSAAGVSGSVVPAHPSRTGATVPVRQVRRRMVH